MNADQAIAAHREWKNRFLAAMGEQKQLNVDEIEADNCCAFGKWLYGRGKTDFGQTANYQKCVAAHAAFHLEAAKVARLVNEGKLQAATSMLMSGTPYAQASEALTIKVIGMFKESSPQD